MGGGTALALTAACNAQGTRPGSCSQHAARCTVAAVDGASAKCLRMSPANAAGLASFGQQPLHPVVGIQWMLGGQGAARWARDGKLDLRRHIPLTRNLGIEARVCDAVCCCATALLSARGEKIARHLMLTCAPAVELIVVRHLRLFCRLAVRPSFRCPAHSTLCAMTSRSFPLAPAMKRLSTYTWTSSTYAWICDVAVDKQWWIVNFARVRGSGMAGKDMYYND
jgi:hypothetical protein